MRFVVDTNIWIRLLQRETKVDTALEAALSRGDEVFLPSIVYFELMRGLRRRGDITNIQHIKRLLQRPFCAYVECTQPIWDHAIKLWVLAHKTCLGKTRIY